MKLRQYQDNIITAIRLQFAKGNKRLSVQSPTGSGKTVIFSYIAKKIAEKGNKILVITDRKELLTQAGSTFEKFGLKPELFTAKTKKVPESDIIVGMSETIKRRISKPDYLKFVRNFDLIIIDENHKNSFNRIFESLTSEQYVLGFSATPYRTGRMSPLSEFYDFLVEGIEISELINLGFLSGAKTFSTDVKGINDIKLKGGEFDAGQMGQLYDNPTLYDGLVKNYNLHAKGKKTLIFSATVKNSLAVCASFEGARHLDANTPPKERDQILHDFKNNKFKILCNVGILTTGYDEPSIECIILYRATRSLPLFLQMCGRGSRVTDEKKEFIILDFGENVKRHGLWEDSRSWSLEIQNPPKKQGMAPVKECPECGAMIHASVMICKFCEHIFVKTQKEKVEVILKEIKTHSELLNFVKNASIQEKFEIAEQKGYNKYWVARQCRTYEELEEFAKIISPIKWSGWLYMNQHKYLG